jgi:hypothetical protein
LRTVTARRPRKWQRHAIPLSYTAGPAVMDGTRLEAVIGADKPFTVSFDPADLLGF